MELTYFISGTRRGIGRALAEHYLSMGFTVVGCSRKANDIEHDRYFHFTVDVGDESEVKSVFAQLAQQGIRIDILINNAGSSISKLALLTGSADAEQVMRSNLLGTFYCSREAIKHMKKGRFGRIINFSSINVPLGSVGSAIYSASKAAVENLACTLSREVSSDNITINTLGLSIVQDSGMASQLDEKAIKDKQSQLIKPALLSNFEIIHAIDFFCSEFAKNITNQIIYFGGRR